MSELNVVHWLRATGEWIAKDSPDVFTPEEAVEALTEQMEEMRNLEGSGVSDFSRYMLFRYVDEESDMEEWDLTRKISTVVNYYTDGEVTVFQHTSDSPVISEKVLLPAVDYGQ